MLDRLVVAMRSAKKRQMRSRLLAVGVVLLFAVLLHAAPGSGHPDESSICCRSMLKTAESFAILPGALALSTDPIQELVRLRAGVVPSASWAEATVQPPFVLVSLLI